MRHAHQKNAGEPWLPSGVNRLDVTGRRRTAHERHAAAVSRYFRPLSEVGEAVALPDGCSAVLVGGTCGINGLIR